MALPEEATGQQKIRRHSTAFLFNPGPKGQLPGLALVQASFGAKLKAERR
jgi:hypothetical protein